MARRITPQERAELIEAIESGAVDENVTAYAEAYAAKKGLNPNTVRSAITRLRKDMGGLRHPGSAQGVRGLGVQPSDHPDWAAGIAAFVLIDADPSSVAKIGAAALVRYERDEQFRRAVDVERAELEKVYKAVDELRNVTRPLSERERQTILRSLQRA